MTDIEGFLTIYGHSDNLLNNNIRYPARPCRIIVNYPIYRVAGMAPPTNWPGFNSRTRCHMWVEIVVGSRPCSEGFLSVSSGFSSLLKNQHFQISIRSATRGPQVCQSQTVRVTLVKQSRFIFILFIYTLISTYVLLFSYCWNHMFII